MGNRRFEDRYRNPNYRDDRGYADDRGYMERAGDQVRSWFGDEEAERRRHADEERERTRDRERDWRERHGMEGRRDWSDRTRWYAGDYDRDRGYDRDRESISRDRDWRSRDRDSSSRDRDSWISRDRDDEVNRTWTGPDRAGEWDRDRRYMARSRDWDEWEGSRRPSRDRGWEVDDGRTQFSPPAQTFGYRYAGQTGSWERNRGRGPKGYQRTDARIYEDVCDRLSHADVDAENIEVMVSNGEVTLAGSVHDRWDKRQAEDLAEDVSGVRDVHNNIRVHRDRDRPSGLGMSDKPDTDRPGSVLGVDKTTPGTTTTGPATTPGPKRST